MRGGAAGYLRWIRLRSPQVCPAVGDSLPSSILHLPSSLSLRLRVSAVKEFFLSLNLESLESVVNQSPLAASD
jgi:hypothetical protein